MDRHGDASVNEAGGQPALLETDLDLDDAGIGKLDGIGRQDRAFVYLHADFFDCSLQFSGKNITLDRGAIPHMDSPYVGLVDLGDNVHLIRLPYIDEAVHPDFLTLLRPDRQNPSLGRRPDNA